MLLDVINKEGGNFISVGSIEKKRKIKTAYRRYWDFVEPQDGSFN